jgi:acyl transferase domain-containing protein
MEPVLPKLGQLLRRMPLHPPRIPYISNVTGIGSRTQKPSDPDYWASHVRRPVRFAEGVARFFDENQEVLLEVGPAKRWDAGAAASGASSRTNDSFFADRQEGR